MNWNGILSLMLKKLWNALSLKKQMQDQYVNNGFKWDKLFTINSMQEKVFPYFDGVTKHTKKPNVYHEWKIMLKYH